MQLYYQIPFNGLFKFLWTYLELQFNTNTTTTTTTNNKAPQTSMDINSSSTAADDFRVRYVSMKIISFLDCLTRASLRSLLVYNKLKYKSFGKLVGKTLREVIKFLSRILLAACDTIRLNYEHFLKRMITTIVYSSRLRSMRWTLLSQLNIGKLDLATKWLLLAVMCGIDVFHAEFEARFQVCITVSGLFIQTIPYPKLFICLSWNKN